MRAPKIDENREPTTATPSVEPSSRVASLTAEPMPAREGGSTSMMDSVAGVDTNPMPSPMSSIWGTMTVGYGVAVSMLPAIHAIAVPKEMRPLTTTVRVPMRGASRPAA
jgi:hypothetical protein